MEYRGKLMRHKIDLRTALLALALVAVASLPVTARALGLGEIKTDTRIGQPFSARIPITGATTGQLQGLHVDLAGHEAYQNANLSEPDYLFSLKFSVKQSPKGPYVLVSSEHPIKLPFLNLLINVRWASGEVTRQYTVLLNPPVFVSNSKSQQPVNAPQAPSSSSTVAQSAPAGQPVASRQPTPSQPVATKPASQPQQQPVASTQAPSQPQPQPSPSQSAPPSRSMPATYKVHHGDTLWGLARRMRPSHAVSVNQMMVAVYQANPHAFRGNINRLKSGYVLQMPSRSQIAQLTAEEATRIVARQNNEWQGARQSATQVASNRGSTSGSTAGEETLSGTATAKTSENNQGSTASAQAPAASTSGRVVLTTPEVTATSSVAAAPGSAGKGSASAAASGGTESASATATVASAQGSQAAGNGASAGGPLKVKSNAMAGLASARTAGAGSAQIQKSSQPASASTVAAAHNNASGGSSAVNNTNSVNSVNSVSSSGSSNMGGGQGIVGTVMAWVMQNTILAVIGAVIVLLGLVALLYLVRRRGSGNGAADSAAPGGTGDPNDAGPVPSGDIEEGIPHETEGTADGSAPEGESGGAGEDLGIATYIGGPSLDVNKVDAIDEADLHSGFGDYGKAAEVLREAIGKEPTRSALRHKLLEVLFAAGDVEAFAQEAELYREHATPEQWEEIAVMGRQLRPGDELFTEAAVSAESTAADSTGENTEFLNIDLDRLSSDTEASSDQSEFERTMDELSTFIETYVPASSDTPVSLQLPPEDQQDPQEQDPAKSPEVSIPDDEPLEFTLDDGDLPALSPETSATEGEYGDDLDGGDESMVDTKLDLARAYIDMGDADSARGVLEEVIDEGDDNQSNEARRLLESLG